MTLVHAKSLFHCLLNIAGHQKSVIASTGQKKRNKVTFSQLIKKILTIFPNSHFIQQVNKIDFPSHPHTRSHPSAGVQAMLPTLSWHHCRCAILLNGYSVTIIPLCIEVCEMTVRGWGGDPKSSLLVSARGHSAILPSTFSTTFLHPNARDGDLSAEYILPELESLDAKSVAIMLQQVTQCIVNQRAPLRG